jgi:hypothetical protein
MAKLAIRCHPFAPAAHDELEAWLEEQANQLRCVDHHAIIRVSRLTQGLPSGDLGIGWVLELELVDESSSLSPTLADKLDATIRDMRLLGLQPTTLAPLHLCEWPARSASSSRQPKPTNAA